LMLNNNAGVIVKVLKSIHETNVVWSYKW